MKNRVCDIARDLMPLAVDSAASEASVAFVEEHVAMCPECAKVYREMRSAQPAAAAQDESDRAFGRSMGRLRKKRRLAAVLTSLLVVVAIATAGAVGYNTFAAHYMNVNGILPMDDVEVRIARLPSGRVLVWAKALDETKRIGTDMIWIDPEGESKSVCMAVAAFTPMIIDQWEPYRLLSGMSSSFWLIDGRLYSVARDIETDKDGAVRIVKPESVRTIRCEGPGSALTLYEEGDDIPLLTREEFLALRGELMCDWNDLSPDEFDAMPAYASAAAEVVRGGGVSTGQVTVVPGNAFFPVTGSTLSEP